MKVWCETQQRIASNFKTDPSVINPSRIMRLPGTVSYLSGKKRAKGYIAELVVLNINPSPRPFTDISSWSNILQKPAPSETLDIDLGKNSLDLNALKEAILSGQNWHDNMLRLVGRLVADGLSTEEILDRAAEFTLPGYTETQTRSELAPMINGALAKGFDKKLTKLTLILISAPAHPHRPHFQSSLMMNFCPRNYCHQIGCSKICSALLDFTLAGDPKEGKSWFTLDLARQILDIVHECLYLSLEDHQRRLKSRLESLILSPSKQLKMLAGLSNESPFPKGKEVISALRKINNDTPELKAIIVDAVQEIKRSSKRGGKGYEETVEEFSRLRSLAHGPQICLLAVHHTIKKNSDAESEKISLHYQSKALALM